MGKSVSTPKPGLDYSLDTSAIVITNNGRCTKFTNHKEQATNNKSQCTTSVDIEYNPTTFTSSDEILLRVGCYHESLSGNKNYSVYKNDKKVDVTSLYVTYNIMRKNLLLPGIKLIR